LKRRNFLGFQILEKRGSLYDGIFRKVVGRFRNHCCHFTTMIQTCAFQDDFLKDRHFETKKLFGFSNLGKER
jgi:hypothetical protein